MIQYNKIQYNAIHKFVGVLDKYIFKSCNLTLQPLFLTIDKTQMDQNYK